MLWVKIENKKLSYSEHQYQIEFIASPLLINQQVLLRTIIALFGENISFLRTNRHSSPKQQIHITFY
jgi:hypothetical protein